jgi:hypothetical protein
MGAAGNFSFTFFRGTTPTDQYFLEYTNGRARSLHYLVWRARSMSEGAVRILNVRGSRRFEHAGQERVKVRSLFPIPELSNSN